MRNTLVLAAIAFAVTFAVMIANRLSQEAMAVVVGALCGISASIPVTLGLFIAATRDRSPRVREEDANLNTTGFPTYPSRPYAAQPPVFVIAPPQQQASPYSLNQGQFYLPPAAPPPGAPRDFKIIGEE